MHLITACQYTKGNYYYHSQLSSQLFLNLVGDGSVNISTEKCELFKLFEST